LDQYLQTPTPQYTLQYGNPVGGTGGSGILYDVNYEEISWGKYPTQIVLQAQAGTSNQYTITNITTTYAYQDGEHDPPPPRSHGVTPGNIQPLTIPLGESGNVVTAVGASSYGGYVGGMSFTTSAIPTQIFYPSTKTDEIPWTFPENSFLVGFGASSERFLNCVCPIWVIFSPCVWKDSDFVRRRKEQQSVLTSIPKKFSPNAPDAMPSPTHLMTDISDFILANFDKIQQLYTQRGGWERWLQCEMGYLLWGKYRGVTCFREIQTYEPSSIRLADIVLWQTLQQTQVIELKCEYLGESTVAASVERFWRYYVDTDMVRVSQVYTQPEWRPARLWAMGVSITADATTRKNSYPMSSNWRTVLGNGWQVQDPNPPGGVPRPPIVVWAIYFDESGMHAPERDLPPLDYEKTEGEPVASDVYVSQEDLGVCTAEELEGGPYNVRQT
jgi:hypothetical protein